MWARTCALLLCCVSFAAFAQQTESRVVDVENTLSECVLVERSDSYDHNNLTLVDFTLTLEQNIGLCGCKSAMAHITLDSGSSSVAFALDRTRTISVPLVHDNTLVNVSSITGALTCGD
uniref:DUF2195 family protein n=1 Tax=Thaumasiovibrio occultus TaxID=1891184 RepID=UPI000B34F0C2|nr:DUF2195 family protein [Thaumasiovibrio occultus]